MPKSIVTFCLTRANSKYNTKFHCGVKFRHSTCNASRNWWKLGRSVSTCGIQLEVKKKKNIKIFLLTFFISLGLAVPNRYIALFRYCEKTIDISKSIFYSFSKRSGRLAPTAWTVEQSVRLYKNIFLCF